MDSDSELKMAIDTTFNYIINEVQLSKLNFNVNVTPFSAYITLKKSTIADKYGNQSLPSPPLSKLLENSLQDKLAAEKNIVELRTALVKCEKYCEELIIENKSLQDQLGSVTELLINAEASNSISKTEVELKEKEVLALKCELKDLKLVHSAALKEHSDYVIKIELENKTQKKLVKYKEKEIYNLNTKLVNM